MNSESPKNILDSYGILPSKTFGQNFLINKGILDKIIQSADIKPGDTILEIGPGLGILTIELAKRAKKVIAIEKDRKMVEILKEKLKDLKNIKIVHADALKLSPHLISNIQNLTSNYKVAANLPYNVATAVIRMFLEAENQPEAMVVLVQKEVAQRICSKPPNMSILAVSVQTYGKPKIISNVSAGSFWPMPKVDSAILKITDIQKPKIDVNLLFKIVKTGFSQPRKQIGGNFVKGLTLPARRNFDGGGSLPAVSPSNPSNGLKLDKSKTQDWLTENDIKPNQRAETLSIKNWTDLTNNFTCYF